MILSLTAALYKADIIALEYIISLVQRTVVFLHRGTKSTLRISL